VERPTPLNYCMTIVMIMMRKHLSAALKLS
jgi:hypothetical protein